MILSLPICNPHQKIQPFLICYLTAVSRNASFIPILLIREAFRNIVLGLIIERYFSRKHVAFKLGMESPDTLRNTETNQIANSSYCKIRSIKCRNKKRQCEGNAIQQPPMVRAMQHDNNFLSSRSAKELCTYPYLFSVWLNILQDFKC